MHSVCQSLNICFLLVIGELLPDYLPPGGYSVVDYKFHKRMCDVNCPSKSFWQEEWL